MRNQRLLNDATESTKGTVYQFYVAVQKCFELISGQTILIERQGDVTICDYQQVETKKVKDLLTDHHINFWKTLKNWMQDGFDATQYTTLILYTTQRLSNRTRFAAWNEALVDQRATILLEIYQEAQERDNLRQKTNRKPRKNIPECLSCQRYVLDSSRQEKLREVIRKFVIASHSPDMPTLYQRIRDQYCKGILQGKQNDFLNALLGFVISPQSVSSNTWEISYEQFRTKVSELTSQVLSRNTGVSEEVLIRYGFARNGIQ